MRFSEVLDSRESTSRSLSSRMLQPSDFLARVRAESRTTSDICQPKGGKKRTRRVGELVPNQTSRSIFLRSNFKCRAWFCRGDAEVGAPKVRQPKNLQVWTKKMRFSEVFDSRESTSRSLSSRMLQPSDFLNQPKTTNLK